MNLWLICMQTLERFNSYGVDCLDCASMNDVGEPLQVIVDEQSFTNLQPSGFKVCTSSLWIQMVMVNMTLRKRMLYRARIVI